jgi:hypothetical protein
MYMIRIGINGIDFTLIVIDNTRDIFFDSFTVIGKNYRIPVFGDKHKMCVKVVVKNVHTLCKTKNKGIRESGRGHAVLLREESVFGIP